MTKKLRPVLWLLSLGVMIPAPLVAAPDSRREAEEKVEISDEERSRFQAALKVLRTTTDRNQMLAAERVLREGFPKSREMLHEAVGSASPWVRSSALKTLGEKGEAKHDQKVVGRGLWDRSPTVRVTAVMAMRRLGDSGLDVMLRYLPTETKPNVRKMAVRTLQEWNDPDAIPALVKALKREKKATVRRFIVRALEALSSRRYGDDVAAWEEYASTYLSKKQKEALFDSIKSSKTKKE